MVQRKVPNRRLGIQSDDIRFEKQKPLGNLKKPSSSDGKSRGSDLKKKMKRSRSIKVSDIEGLRSSPLNKIMAQPGNPPPLKFNVVAPQKQALIKTVGGSPNYMKSTSSSEAKKESSLVSSWNSDTRNLCRRNLTTNSKRSSVSSNKSAKTMAKTSSLKLVRSLTKTPSFKPTRSLPKKCSRFALCADINAQKATCSSTFKDPKFPPYLMLNPGGTESQGTSVMKVCPYTYCSLNGHHHTPVPPLKCYLFARRRSLKIQRCMRLEVPSSGKAKPKVNGIEEIDIEQVVSDENPALSPWGQGGMDFFIEIYTKNEEDDAEANEGTTHKDSECTTESEENKFSHGDGDGGAIGEADDRQVSENLSEGSPHFDENLKQCSEINSEMKNHVDDYSIPDLARDVSTRGSSLYPELDFDGNLEQCGEINSEMKNDADDYSTPDLVREVSATGSFSNGYDSEGECHSSIVTDDGFGIGMEWEQEQFSASESDNEAHSSMDIDGEFHFDIEVLSKEPEISSDDIVNNPSKPTSFDGVEQEDFEADTPHTDNFSQVSCTLDYGQVSSTKDVFDAWTTMGEEEAQADLIGIMTIPNATKEQLLEEEVVIETDNKLPEAAKNNYATEDTDEALNKTNIQLRFFDESGQDDKNEDYNGIQNPEDSEADQTETVTGNLSPAKDRAGMEEEVDDCLRREAFPVDNNVEENYLIRDTADESPSAESQDHLSDGQGQNESISDVENTDSLEDGQDRARKYKIPNYMDSDEEKNSRMHKSHLAEGSTEPEKMEVEGNNGPDVAEIFGTSSDVLESERTISLTGSKMSQELPGTCNNRKWTIRCKRQHENSEEQRKFNPQEPNFLPLVPEPDAEKVDLRHQMIDERKNSEEWMLDYALRQAVTRLAPARKRKVALLVEAFETVTPAPFAHGRPIQACS